MFKVGDIVRVTGAGLALNMGQVCQIVEISRNEYIVSKYREGYENTRIAKHRLSLMEDLTKLERLIYGG